MYSIGNGQRSWFDQYAKKTQIASSYLSGSIYDLFELLASNKLHLLYSEFVDQIVRAVAPIHFSELTWSKSFVKNMLAPNDFIFIQKAHYFKKISETNSNAHIQARTFRKKVEVKFGLDTRDMFGVTSMTCSFSGHKSCSAIVQIKSIDKVDGITVLSCTPISLGVGFQKPEMLRVSAD